MLGRMPTCDFFFLFCCFKKSICQLVVEYALITGNLPQVCLVRMSDYTDMTFVVGRT